MPKGVYDRNNVKKRVNKFKYYVAYKMMVRKSRVILYGLLPARIASKRMLLSNRVYYKGDILTPYWKRLERFNNIEQAAKWLVYQQIEGDYEIKELLQRIEELHKEIVEKLQAREEDYLIPKEENVPEN